MSETKVTSTEFGAKIGLYFQKAMTEPVTITHHGRDSVVLLSSEEFQRLKRRDRRVYAIEDIPQKWVDAIATAEPPAEAEAFNHEVPEGWESR